MSRPPVCDLDHALNALEGDQELLRRMARVYLQQSAGLLKDVEAALLQGDGPALERAAHKLRGAVSNFAAASAQEAAFRLEQMGRQGNFSGAADAHGDLEAAMRELDRALAAYSEDRVA